MPLSLHATAVAHRGAGLLFVGPSGSGKSRLAAEMLLHDAQLVADDRVNLTVESGMLVARPAVGYETLLELRHLGIIRASQCAPFHPLHLVAELSVDETPRLPEPQTRAFLGVDLPCLTLGRSVPAASLLLYLGALREGRLLPTDWRPEKSG